MSQKLIYEELARKVKELKGELENSKQGEKALEEAESYYRAFFEHGVDGVVVLDPETARPINFNDQACRQLGYSREEFARLRLPDIEASEKDERIQVHLQKVLNNGFDDFETLQRTKQGEIRHVHVSAQRIDIAGRQVYHCIWRDITKHKRAEEAFRQSEQKYRTLVEESFDGIFVQKGSKIIFTNHRLNEILGYEEGELLGLDHWLLYHPDYQELTRTRAQARMRGEKIVSHYEVTFQRKDGSWIDGEVLARVINFEGELGIQVWVRDITDRVRAEAALRESEERFRTLVEESPLAISLIGKNGRYKYINPQFQNMFGYSIDDVTTGTEWFKKAFPDEGYRRSAIETWIEDLKQTGIGQSRPRTFTVTCKDGSHKEVYFRPVTMENLDQFVIHEDITERKRAEEEKVRLETQLRQAQKMEALGTLAGGIAHDFNNILAAMMGYTELALMDISSGLPNKERLEQILKSGLRAKNLIQQILSFSRRSDPERKPIQITPVIAETLKLLRATLPTTIEIVQEVDPGPDNVFADPTQIHQLLMNLGANAAHAMRDRGGVLKVGLKRFDLDKKWVTANAELNPGAYTKLTVSDTGEGMDKNTLERIFEPFFTTKETGQGTGMGLAVTHGIVKAHGGAITVKSEPGKGSTFYVYLPLLETEAEEDAPGDAESLPTGTEHVLFVDDETVLVDIGRQMLERLGYHVTARTSSIEALEVFKAKPDSFHLVITDQTMPNMTGVDLTKEILRIRPDIPIIICTGYNARISAITAEEIGVRRILMKPMVIREVAQAVRRVLDKW